MKKNFIAFLFIIGLSSILNSGFGPWDTKLVQREQKRSTPGEKYITSTPGWVLVKSIRWFQIFISPQDGPNCRYTPTCSQYGLICVQEYGAIMGMIMAVDRYMRCNPFGAWGKDLPSDNYFFNSSSEETNQWH
ncbi:MAG: membrane protein insertion efficiency factor YidD [Spirochaetes bacterium]|nr:membrane protein insertion efficiency factor YidD [Spirochaetota bacterium]